MNSRLSRVATVKASHLPNRLSRRFHIKTDMTISDWLIWFEVLGYTVQSDIEMGVEGNRIEQRYYDRGVLYNRLYKALKQINPKVSKSVLETAISQVTDIECCNLFDDNYRLHKYLTEGIDIQYSDNDQVIDEKVWLIDSLHLLNNDWLVTYQSNLVESSFPQSSHVIVFINGLPLAIIVFTTCNKKYTLKHTYQKLQFYKQQIPTLFFYNAFLIITSGKQARVGTLTSPWEEFFPWGTIDGEDFPDKGQTDLEVLIQGLFDKRRFLELLKHYIVFEQKETSKNKHLLRHPFCTIPHHKISHNI